MGENTLSDKAAAEIGKTVREVARRMMNEKPDRGRWQFHGGSGGGHTIWFEISQVLCPGTDYVEETTLVVTPTWYTGGCNKTPPGATYEGTYEVFDICNLLRGLTPTDLEGGTGKATYMYPLSGYCEPRWIVDEVCPQPEC